MCVWFYLFMFFLCVCIICGALLKKAAKRLMEYDDLVMNLHEDIVTNINHFNMMSESQLLSNEPQVIKAHRNMMIMNARLKEYGRIIDETRGFEEGSNLYIENKEDEEK